MADKLGDELHQSIKIFKIYALLSGGDRLEERGF